MVLDTFEMAHQAHNKNLLEPFMICDIIYT